MPFDEYREDGSGGDRSHQWSDLHDYGDMAIHILLSAADGKGVCTPCALQHMMGMLTAFMAWKLADSREGEPEQINVILDKIREIAETYQKEREN